MADPVLSAWSSISKLTLVHPKSYESKLYYIPFDASRRALQNGVFGFSTLDTSPYPTGSFETIKHRFRKVKHINYITRFRDYIKANGTRDDI